MTVTLPDVSTETPRSQPASIRDVARLAGVSHQTVSRVINNHPSLRSETRDRVQAAIDQLQYRPSRIARALGASKSGAIGVVASQRLEYGPGAMIIGIEEAAREAGYLINTTNLVTTSPDDIRRALESQVDNRVDGIVIIAPQQRVQHALDELAIDLPYVMLNCRSSDDPHEVFVDQLAGARAATRHLIDLGHTDMYHLAGPQEWLEADARMQGFLLELSDADLSATPPILGDWTADFGYLAGRELARRGDFTAIFSSNDQMALGLLHAFRDVGVDVPGDVSVIGFDDIPEARHFWPPLTTVRQDFTELGRHCVTRLLSAVNEQILSAQSSDSLVPQLVVRSSTAPPRA